MLVNKAAALLMLVALPGCASGPGHAKALHPGPAERSSTTDLPVAAAASGAPVVVAPEVLHGFAFLYQYINETEFVLCLEGRQTHGRVHVTGFRLAVMKHTTLASASYEPCTNDHYIGTAHNHPGAPYGASCAPSSLDRSSFASDTRAFIDIILCGSERYLWVLKDGRSETDSDGISRLRRLVASTAR